MDFNRKTYKKHLITQTHSTLHLKKPFRDFQNMTKHRSLREKHDQKIGSHRGKFGLKPKHQQLNRFKVRNLYNSIPREITSIASKSNFKLHIKKWIKNPNHLPIKKKSSIKK